MQLLGNNPQDRLPDHLLRRIAKHPAGRLVPARNDPIQRLRHDRIIGRLDDRRQPKRRLLRPPPLTDVMGNLRRSDNPPRVIPHRGDRQRHLDQLAILLDAPRLILMKALARLDLLQDLGLFPMQALWNQPKDRLPHHLLRGIPEHPARRLIPTRNGPRRIFADNSVEA